MSGIYTNPVTGEKCYGDGRPVYPINIIEDRKEDQIREAQEMLKEIEKTRLGED